MNYFPHSVILAQLCLSCMCMVIGPTREPNVLPEPIPTPSPNANVCMNNVPCFNIWLTRLSRHGFGDDNLRVCCDFKQRFDCVLSHIRNQTHFDPIAGQPICSQDQIEDFKSFATAMMDYLIRNKCPTANLNTDCKNEMNDGRPRHGNGRPGHVKTILDQIESSNDYKTCMDSMAADTECLREWNAIKCREEYVNSVYTEDVVAVRQYNENRILEIDSGICQNDVLQ